MAYEQGPNRAAFFPVKADPHARNPPAWSGPVTDEDGNILDVTLWNDTTTSGDPILRGTTKRRIKE